MNLLQRRNLFFALFISSAIVFLYQLAWLISQSHILSIRKSIAFMNQGNGGMAVRNIDVTDLELKRSFSMNKSNELFWEAGGDYIKFKDAQSAKFYYQKAIEQNPAKARLWVKFAYIKSVNGEFDQDFHIAYENAYLYGAWEYSINESLLRMAFYNWHSISVDTRMLLKKILIRMFEHRPHQTLSMAKEYGHLRMACLWVRNIGEIQPACKKELP